MPPAIHENLKKRILAPLFLAIASLTLSAVLGIYWLESDSIKKQNNHLLKHVHHMFYGNIKKDTELLNGLLDAVETDPSLQQAWLAGDREGLLQQAQTRFEQLKSRYRVTHFYFIDINRICFLRVHQPTRHSDLIQRFTMQQAHDTGTTAHGIELGPLGTFTLRVVRPWHINGELVGYLELGEEIDHIIANLKEIEQTKLGVAIHKDFLQRDSWEKGQALLQHEAQWEQFPGYVFNNGIDTELTPQLKDSLQTILDKQHHTEYSTGQIVYDIHPFPLMDAGNRQVGKMIIMHDISDLRQSLHTSIITLLGIAFLVTLALMTFFYQYISRIERNLAHSRRVAEKESKQKIIALANSNRIKTSFMANMSHEIRTPMNGMLGMLQLVQESPLSDEQKGYINIANNSANHLLTLLNDILDSSKLESDQFTLERITYDIRELSKNTVASVSAIARQKGLVVTCNIHADTPSKIMGDPTRMRQILSNLLNNAIKFTERGAITLSIQPIKTIGKQGALEFKITDTGIGISADAIHRIFDSYSQADESVTRKYGGTGLGLAIAKHLVEKMGGEISVSSTPGMGSTFSFLTPIEVSLPQYISTQKPVRNVSELRVLITSHNVNNCLNFSNMLSELDIRSDTNTDIDTCAHTLHSAAQAGDPFHIVITDTTGLSKQELQLAQEIRQDTNLRENTHLILLINTGFRGDAYIARKAGYQAYLTYPIDKHLLNNCINTVIQLPHEQSPDMIVTRHLLKEHKIHHSPADLEGESPPQAKRNQA